MLGMATKKIGSMGRFGPRYGTRTKTIAREIEKLQKQAHECPYCERNAVSRVSAGIWHCDKCNKKFAGGAYMPRSVVAAEALRAAEAKLAAQHESVKKEMEEQKKK